MDERKLLRHVAMDKEMTTQMIRIWALMILKMKSDYIASVTQEQIVDELEIKKADVSKAIKKLIEKGLLVHFPDIETAEVYRISDPSISSVTVESH